MFLPKELEMAKQVVIEIHKTASFRGFDENGNKIFRKTNNPKVLVTHHYRFDQDLIGKKEWEEVITWQGGNKTVKYWVRVPDNIEPVYQTWEDKQNIIANRRKIKAEKKQEIWSKLQEEKNERIKRYAEMAQLGELFTGKLVPTDEDLESARKLQSVSLRAQNKQMCKLG